MFDGGKRDVDFSAQSIIASGTVIKGEVFSKNSIKIEGEVEGKIESKETVIVFETGKVKAEIRAKQAIISGEVVGDIIATERLEITANGKVRGNITSPRISIAEGVFFEGVCSMQLPATGANQASIAQASSNLQQQNQSQAQPQVKK